MLDANLVSKGEDYGELPDIYVISITERDVLGMKLPICHIDRVIRENGAEFPDGTHILYVNGEIRDESPLGRLMQDFTCSDPADMNYPVLAQRVRCFKEDEKGVLSMCRLLEEMCEETREETAMEERRNFASRLLQIHKLSHQEIAECSKLSVEEVKRLAEEMGM